MREFVIDHPHNEASALIAIHNQHLLERFGWDVGFWIASDEHQAHQAIAALGRRRKARKRKGGGWQVVRLKCRRSKHASRDTDDCEAMARAGGWVYVFGSQYGGKGGPLDPRRHFVARFNESLVEARRRRRGRRRLAATMDVARRPFLVHRLVNDALRASGLDVIGRGKRERKAFITATRRGAGPRVRRRGRRLTAAMDVARRPFLVHRLVNDALRAGGIDLIETRKHERKAFIKATRRGAGGGRPRKRVRKRDHAVNVEGATFLPNGRLLLGLRYPVTAAGNPILVEVDGIDRAFERGRSKEVCVTRVWTLRNVGSARRPKGVRELDQRGLTVHVITGDLESRPQDSSIARDHPQATRARSEHWTFEVPDDDAEVRLKAKRVRRFGRDANVEGFALFEHGCVWYAHDDERIRLQRADARR